MRSPLPIAQCRSHHECRPSRECRSDRGRLHGRSRLQFLRVAAVLLPLLLGTASVEAQLDTTLALPDMGLIGVDPVASNPYGSAPHPTLPLLYVALTGQPTFGDPALANGSTVVEIDLETHEVLRAFSVGYFPTEVLVSSDGTELFTVASTDGTISRVNLSTGAVTTVPIVDLGGVAVGFPLALEFDPTGTRIIVTSNGGGFDGSQENLVVLDRATLATVDSVELVGGLGRFAVLSDGRVVLPVGYPDDVFPSNPQVRILDSSNDWTQLSSVTLPMDIADFPAPVDIAVSEDEQVAYVTVLGGSSAVFVIDLSTGALQPSLPLPFIDFSQHGIALVGDRLFVSDFDAGQVRVLDVVSGAVLETLPTGAGPNALTSFGGRLYVTNQLAESISSFALAGAFRRGDVNEDGSADIADGIALLTVLFGGGSVDCQDSADFNDDGVLDVADPITLFAFLFTGGSPLAYPATWPGQDLTSDALSCE